MEHARALGPAELATDVFDRASTLNFTVVAHVEGRLTAEELTRALRSLEQKHPLLRARIDRGGALRFVPGEAAPIPLRVEDGEPAAWSGFAEESLAHRIWPDEGPRAELTWLRHGSDRSTLLLCLHHLVSDGSSGILAMRDLLRFAGDPAATTVVVPSPGQHAFYPAGHGDWSWKLRTVRLLLQSLFVSKPKRLRESGSAALPRSVRVRKIALSVDDSAALLRQARADGATVHGVVCAALARAVLGALGVANAPQRILHPVDLRRYLRAAYPELPAAGDAVGYYVSSLDTDHAVTQAEPLGALARNITAAVREKKAAGVPLLTAPIAGGWVTGRAPRTGDLPALRKTFEQSLFLTTFALTNLGPLEKLGVEPRYGALHVADMFFVAAGSVFGTLGASVTSFGGALTIAVNWVSPLVADATGEQIASSVETELAEYVGAVSDVMQPDARDVA